MGAEARLRGWSEVARSRRGALSLGCRNGDSPLRSPAPSPPLSLSFSLSLSLVCKCISISYDLSVSFFSLAMISLFLIPSHSLARSLYLFPSIFVSLTLSFPTARPAFILIPLPPWVFLVSVSLFSFFFFFYLFIYFSLRGEFSDSWGKKK